MSKVAAKGAPPPDLKAPTAMIAAKKRKKQYNFFSLNCQTNYYINKSNKYYIKENWSEVDSEIGEVTNGVVLSADEWLRCIDSDMGLIGIDNEGIFVVGKVKRATVIHNCGKKKKESLQSLMQKLDEVKKSRGRGEKRDGICDAYYNFGFRYATLMMEK